MVTWTTIEPIDIAQFWHQYNLAEVSDMLAVLDKFMDLNDPNRKEKDFTEKELLTHQYRQKRLKEDYELMIQYTENQIPPNYWFPDHNFYILSCSRTGDYHFTDTYREEKQLKNAEYWLRQLQFIDDRFKAFKVRHNYEY